MSNRGCDPGWDPNAVRPESLRLADRKQETRVILFPTEPSTIGSDRIREAVERVLARRVK